jgi:hypothetical protein
MAVLFRVRGVCCACVRVRVRVRVRVGGESVYPNYLSLSVSK